MGSTPACSCVDQGMVWEGTAAPVQNLQHRGPQSSQDKEEQSLGYGQGSRDDEETRQTQMLEAQDILSKVLTVVHVWFNRAWTHSVVVNQVCVFTRL